MMEVPRGGGGGDILIASLQSSAMGLWYMIINYNTQNRTSLSSSKDQRNHMLSLQYNYACSPYTHIM